MSSIFGGTFLGIIIIALIIEAYIYNKNKEKKC